MDRAHKEWLEFVRMALAVPISYSSKDLSQFRRIAEEQYPSLVKVVEAYIHFSKQNGSETGAGLAAAKPVSRNTNRSSILDLLRDPRLFPHNATIAAFAQRVVPNMRSYRFDKMSKGDIALRILQHLETLDSKTRTTLERSMRDALDHTPEHDEERLTFMSKWEDIIKGIKMGS